MRQRYGLYVMIGMLLMGLVGAAAFELPFPGRYKLGGPRDTMRIDTWTGRVWLWNGHAYGELRMYNREGR